MPPAKINIKDLPVVILASGFGSGYSPFASGTAGSAVGVAIFYLIHDWSLPAYLLFTLGVVLVGIPISTRAEKIFGQKDSGKIVIDEIAGQLITFIYVPISPVAVAAGFFLFRLFDVWKPKPVRALESLPGGLGVMLDDVGAGLLALAVLQILLLFL